MGKFLKMSVMELGKIFRTKGIYIGIFIAMLFSTAIGIQAKITPQTFNSTHVYSFFSSICNLVLIVYGAKSLADEFQMKTSTQLFTSKQSRTKILLIKNMSMIFLALILAVIGTVILEVFKVVLGDNISASIVLRDLWTEVYTFVLYAFVISTFASFVTILSLNTTTAIVGTLAAFFLAPNIISMMMNKFPKMIKVLEIVPFYSADSLTNYHNVGTTGIIILVFFGVAFLLANITIMNRLDLR